MAKTNRTSLAGSMSIKMGMSLPSEGDGRDRAKMAICIDSERSEQHLLLMKFANKFAPCNGISTRVTLRASKLAILSSLMPLSNLCSCG